MTNLNTAPTANETQFLGYVANSLSVGDMIVVSGKTPAAVRSVLNRMTHKGLITGGSTAPALPIVVAPATPAAAAPAPAPRQVLVTYQNGKEWLVALHGETFRARVATTRAAALEAALEEASLAGLGHFTLVNRLHRTVSYTVKGGKAVKGAVA